MEIKRPAESSLVELAEKTLRSFHIQNNTSDINLNVSGSPIVGLVDKIISSAISVKASDIHIEPQTENLRIRLRIDGILVNYANLPVMLHSLIISRIKILSGMNTVEKRQPQDGSLSYKYEAKTIDIRIAIVPTIYGEKMVMRLLNVSGRLFTINELELSEANENLFYNLFHRPSGLILNTGPVNSGKTTTLYAALNVLNSTEKNIMTIEDPVEYKLSGINQMQIDGKMGLTFENGLHAILRQDPDIILIGEIRDGITAKTAIRAALTGHLVLSTLHTNSAASAILRMLDMGVEPYLLSATLAGCISQRLLRRICPYCASPYTAPINSSQSAFIEKYCIPKDKIYYGKGCEKCHNTAYSGRIAVQEILTVNNILQKAVSSIKDGDSFKEIAVQNGMRPLLYDAIDKVLQKKTTIDEIIRIISDNDM